MDWPYEFEAGGPGYPFDGPACLPSDSDLNYKQQNNTVLILDLTFLI